MADKYDDELDNDLVNDDNNDLGEFEKEIIYNGKKVKITSEKDYDNLAQQGLDYTKKMQKIAPYRKLVELLESDTGAVEHLNSYFQKKLGLNSQAGTVNQGVQPVQRNVGQDHALFIQTLKANNVDFDDVMAEVIELVSKEPAKIQMLADQDIDTFMNYYQKASKKVAEKRGGKHDELPNIESANSFVLPGLEKETSEVTKAKKIWEYNSKTFNQMLNKVKGLE